MDASIQAYNKKQTARDQEICTLLASVMDKELNDATSKVWHAHPVWFLEGNPIVGYNKQIPGMRLMFWSGKSFQEEGLNVVGKKFEDASVFYNDVSEIDKNELIRWLKKARTIQWNYKNIVKRKGQLDRLL